MSSSTKRNEIAAGLNTSYTMHTATLKMHLTYREMKMIKGVLFNELDKEKPDNENNVKKYFEDKKLKYKTSYTFLVTEKWNFNYIKIVEYKNKQNDILGYWMEIKINPRAMLHHQEYAFVYVATKEDIEACIKIINSFWKEVGLDKWIDLKLLYIQRIDYCVNIFVGNEDMSNIYMRLMRKGAYPYKSKRMKEYSETAKRYIDTKNSFTVTSGSFEFSVYNKYKQLKEEGKKYSAEEIERAKGIIRIELRVSRNKVRREELKHGIKGVEELLKITNQVAQENIPRYVALAYGTGAFMRMKEAKAMIDNSNLKKKTKTEMKNILLCVSRRNLQDVKEEYGDKFSYYMNYFNSMRISPITLPSNSVEPGMPNLLYYINNHCANFNSEIERK